MTKVELHDPSYVMRAPMMQPPRNPFEAFTWLPTWGGIHELPAPPRALIFAVAEERLGLRP